MAEIQGGGDSQGKGGKKRAKKTEYPGGYDATG